MADDKFVYSEVYTYRTTGEYPPDSDKNDKRSLRRKAGNFRVEDGRLYYIGNQEKRSGKAPPTDVKRMVVETEEEQRRIIKLIHEEAHLGVNRVPSMITPKYYWPGMYQDVESYINCCEKCQRSKPKLKKTPGVLHPIPVVPKAWHQIGIDLVGPLPETPNGNKFICTVTDYYTKWAEVTALPSKHATGVVNFLYKLFCVFGCPSLIISDQGREFVNEMSALLFTKTNTQHRVTSAYHPQTNGLTERFNQTLSNCLVSKINESQTDWDES